MLGADDDRLPIKESEMYWTLNHLEFVKAQLGGIRCLDVLCPPSFRNFSFNA